MFSLLGFLLRKLAILMYLHAVVVRYFLLISMFLFIFSFLFRPSSSDCTWFVYLFVPFALLPFICFLVCLNFGPSHSFLFEKQKQKRSVFNLTMSYPWRTVFRFHRNVSRNNGETSRKKKFISFWSTLSIIKICRSKRNARD